MSANSSSVHSLIANLVAANNRRRAQQLQPGPWQQERPIEVIAIPKSGDAPYDSQPCAQPSFQTGPPESARGPETGQLPKIDPLLCQAPLPLVGVFHPHGFAVEIHTNAQTILAAAAESWRDFTFRRPGPALHLRFCVSEEGPPGCPPTPLVRARGHQLVCVADAYNHYVCDLERGVASGWLNRATLEYPSYLRYHLLDSAALVLLTNRCATPIHGACVSRHGRGLLLCGISGAGKSSLAYACARAGWTYTSDDASYLLEGPGPPRVSGNSHKLRFRPTAADLFPELQGLGVTPRAEGKPSIEVSASNLPFAIKTAEEAPVHCLVFLNRQPGATAELLQLPSELAWPRLFQHIFPADPGRQASAIQRLSTTAVYELRYSDLQSAVDRLDLLARLELLAPLDLPARGVRRAE
jgi:hypothetical protein